MYLKHQTIKKFFRSCSLSKGNHGKRYMNLICSFLSELPFQAGDEVDALDGQDMWCPVYILRIDLVKSQVLISHKYFAEVHDEWLPISRIMPANSKRFKQFRKIITNSPINFYLR